MDDAPVTRALLDYFSTHPAGIAAAYLFGSVARGTASETSDGDLAVLFVTDPPRTLDAWPAALSDDLTRVMGRHADLVVLNRTSLDLAMRVLRDGVLVFEGDRSARVRWEVRTRNEYWDLEPYLTDYRRPRATADGAA